MTNSVAEPVSKADMDGLCLVSVLLVVSATTGCILRPGMNSDCSWPTEPRRPLNLEKSADHRHLMLDSELLEELVDRYRFHSADEQRRCDDRLVAVVADTHSVDVRDVARARARISNRGLDLPVTIPVSAAFIFCVSSVLRRIARRFTGEPLPFVICLIAASVILPGLFLWVGEFWTSILQMIRVGSQHVGGRVQKLPWVAHPQQIFIAGVGLFWLVVAVQSGSRALRSRRRGRTARLNTG